MHISRTLVSSTRSLKSRLATSRHRRKQPDGVVRGAGIRWGFVKQQAGNVVDAQSSTPRDEIT